jgi:hypothetical protein
MKTLQSNTQYMYKHIAFIIFMITLMLVIFENAKAQEAPPVSKTSSSYFRFGVGYGFPSGSQLLGVNSTSTSTNTSYTSKQEGIYGSLGSGFTFNSSYLHMYSKNIGLDLGLQYVWGKKYESTSSSSGQNNTYTEKNKIYSRGLLFGPSLIVMMGENKVRPYVQIGITAGSIKVHGEDSYSNFKTTTEYYGGISIGFKGGFGIDAPISENAKFFTECVFTSMSYYPKKGTITYSDGSPQQKVEFEKDITYNVSNSNPNPAPNTQKELRSSLPFGSIALNIGLKLQLKKKV